MKHVLRRLLFSLFAVVLAMNIAGCRKGCVTCPEDNTPATPACSFSVTPLSQNFSYLGGGGNVVVITQSGCSWNAVSNAAWVTITAVSSSSVQNNVQANTGPARTGTISVAGQTVTITQDAGPSQPPPNPQPTPRPPQPTPQPTPPNPTPTPTPQPTPTPEPPCTYAVGGPPTFTYQGGNGGLSVNASRSNCSWNATTSTGWIEITAGSSGTGNGTVSFRVGGNSGPARTGTISVAGKTVTISQNSQ